MDDWFSEELEFFSSLQASLPLQTVNVCACVDDEGWRSVRGQHLTLPAMSSFMLKFYQSDSRICKYTLISQRAASV